MSPSDSGTTTREMVVIAGVGALVLSAIALTAYPSLRVAPAEKNAPPKALAQPVQVAPAAPTDARRVSLEAPVAALAPPAVPRAVVERAPQTPVRSTIVWPPASHRSSPPAVAAATGAAAVSSETDALGRTLAVPAATPTTTPDAVSPSITMSGCLEATVDGDQFRLTDIDGADAPKARSWRSGFLKKRSAPVDLVELSDPVALRKYVGRRMVATGQLSGRELRVRSLQAAGTSCK
jgi:hypothetical protein